MLCHDHSVANIIHKIIYCFEECSKYEQDATVYIDNIFTNISSKLNSYFSHMYAYENKNTKREKQRDRQSRDNKSTVSSTPMHPLLPKYPERQCRGIRGHSELYLEITESSCFSDSTLHLCHLSISH